MLRVFCLHVVFFILIFLNNHCSATLVYLQARSPRTVFFLYGMMLVPLSWTMSLLFSPFGERAWVGPGICVSEMSNRYYCVLLLAGVGGGAGGVRIKKNEQERCEHTLKRKCRSSESPCSRLSAYSSSTQISAPMTSYSTCPRDQWGWLPILFRCWSHLNIGQNHI